MGFSFKAITTFVSLFIVASLNAQTYTPDTLKVYEHYDNIYVKGIYSDSLTSHFAIWIKLKVKEHKHELHTEQVYVLEGKGKFTLADSTFTIKKGDFIFIPKNTYHSVIVTSKKPMKVISLQAPYFDGTDRVYKPIPE